MKGRLIPRIVDGGYRVVVIVERYYTHGPFGYLDIGQERQWKDEYFWVASESFPD